MSAKLSVDGSRCTGHGRCRTAAPKLLTDDDEGFVTLRGRWLTPGRPRRDAGPAVSPLASLGDLAQDGDHRRRRNRSGSSEITKWPAPGATM